MNRIMPTCTIGFGQDGAGACACEIPSECFSGNRWQILNETLDLALRTKYEALGVPGASLFPHLLASVNALDEDQSDSWRLSSAEFEALLKGAPNKKMQALRDTLMCEGAPWKASELVSAAEVHGDGVVDALQIPRALPGHKIDNLDELDWRVVRDNFADYFYGIELIWDQDHQDLQIFGRACEDGEKYLEISVKCVAQCLLALPPAFLARRQALRTIYLIDTLASGDPEHYVGGVACGTTIWVNASQARDEHDNDTYNVVFHELYHCIDYNDDAVNPDPEDRRWRSLNADGFKYAAERTPPQNGGCAMQGRGACMQGFASDYGTLNTREDKATVFELWMTRRPLALARMAALYDAKEMVVDGAFCEEYDSLYYVTKSIAARGPDKILARKVARLIEEVIKFVPEMADVLKICPEHRIAHPHILAVGDRVLCKYPAYRERGDNPWFMGTVVAIASESATIRYEDGDEASGVLAEELYYCPEGPFDNSIGKSVRFNYIKRIAEEGNVGQLRPVTFGHVLAVDEPVLCKYPAYRGKADNPWFMGTVADVSAESATIRYEDGDVASGVLAEELFYCPHGPFNMTIGKSVRSSDVEFVIAQGHLGKLRPVVLVS
eukprot:g3802.t1